MEWIACSGGLLPEFNKKVLVLYKHGTITIASLLSITGIKTAEGNETSLEWYERQSYDTYYEIVTHWMPLPEPPKES